MAFWTYILRCADGRYFTGQTDTLDRRIAKHQTGGFCDFTARRRPVALVWSESFASRIEALEAERQLKGWSRAKKEALFAGDWKRVSYFARPPAERSQDEPVRGTRPSTTLGTNGDIVTDLPSTPHLRDLPEPFVSSEVEIRSKTPVASPAPFVSSEVEIRHATPEPRT